MTVAGYPEQTASERHESLLQAMSDHHRGEHDWSSPDPYDCTVCHVLIELYGDERAVEERRAIQAELAESFVHVQGSEAVRAGIALGVAMASLTNQRAYLDGDSKVEPLGLLGTLEGSPVGSPPERN